MVVAKINIIGTRDQYVVTGEDRITLIKHITVAAADAALEPRKTESFITQLDAKKVSLNEDFCAMSFEVNESNGFTVVGHNLKDGSAQDLFFIYKDAGDSVPINQLA